MIKAEIRRVRSAEYRQELVQSGRTTEIIDSIIRNTVKELKYDLKDLVYPCYTDIKYAMESASSEIKHVFGVMGLTARTFCRLVNWWGFHTVHDLIDYNERWNVQGLPLSSGSKEKLHTFLRWYECYRVEFRRAPVFEVEFTKEVWMEFNAYGEIIYFPLRHFYQTSEWIRQNNESRPYNSDCEAYEAYQHYSEVECLCKWYDMYHS